MLAPCSRGLGRRRRFQHVAEAGYTRLTMEGITARRYSEQRRAARESLTCQHFAQRPGDSSGR
jgi:hypothetical protein